MAFKEALEDMKFDGVEYHKTWSFWVGMSLYVLGLFLSRYLERHVRLGAGVGDDPPWYFIREHYINGLVMAAFGLLSVLPLLRYWNRSRDLSLMHLIMSLSLFGIPAWDAFVIALRSDHVLDRALARTDWATFDSFQNDPLRWGGGILLIVVLLVAAFRLRHRVQRAAQTAQAA